MTNWTIFDSQTTRLNDFSLEWLPPQSGQYITPHIIRHASSVNVALEAGPYIGALPLSNGDTLFIEPRVGRAALSRMLSVTARLDKAVRKEFEEFANLGYGEQDRVSWLQLLGRSFCNQLRLIDKNSLRPDRVRIHERRQTVKGEISIAPTLIGLKRQETSPIHCTYRVKSYDTVEQHVLAAAAQTLLQFGSVDDDNRGIVLKWSSRLGGERLSGDELSQVIRDLNAGHYTGSRSYYIPALVMAHLILVQNGISFNASHTVQTEALLTNIYTLFEGYMRITLRNELVAEGYVVEKLESGAPTLFADGTAELRPDVIISDRQGVRLLVDAKYKLHQTIQAADYYQMATYLQGYQVSHGVIVRPQVSITNTPMSTRRMNYGGFIHELNIGLNDWQQAEQALVEHIKSVLAVALGS